MLGNSSPGYVSAGCRTRMVVVVVVFIWYIVVRGYNCNNNSTVGRMNVVRIEQNKKVGSR